MPGPEGGFGRSRLAWWIVIAALSALIAYVLYLFLGAFLLGLFVYYATRPVYRRSRQWIRSPTAAVIAALLAFALPILLLITYAVSVGVTELSTITGAELDRYAELLGPYINVSTATRNPQQALAAVPGLTRDSIAGVLGELGTYLGVVGSALIQFFVVFAIAFYLLRDDEKLAGWVCSMIGEQSTAYAYLTAVDRDLRTIYFGNILTAFAIAIVATITYNILAVLAPADLTVPSPTLLGLLTGIGSLIPVIGIKLIYVPIAAYLGVRAVLTDPGVLWFSGVFAVVGFVVVDTIPELLLRPYLSSRDLHIGLVMLAYILGPLAFGWYGLFLGPLLLVLIIQAALLVFPDLVQGREILPDSVAGELFDSDASPGADPAPKTVDLADEDPSESGESTDGGESENPANSY